MRSALRLLLLSGVLATPPGLLLAVALPGCFSSQTDNPDAAAADDSPTADVGDAGDVGADAPAIDAATPDSAMDGHPGDASPEAADGALADSPAIDGSAVDAPIDGQPSVDACGTCGGSCVAGHCIEVLSPSLGSVTGLAVDATSVYWCTGGGSVLKAPLGGLPDGGSPTVLATGINFPNAVAVDSNAVYVADYADGLVLSLPLTGVPDGGTPAMLVSGLGSPAGLAVDSTTLYITDNDGTVRTAPVAGVAASLFASDGAQPNGAWLFGGNLYWIDLGGGAVKVAPKVGIPDGGVATTILTVGGTPHHVAVDATSIYWLDGTAGIIESAPIGGLPDGGLPTPVASGQDQPDGLAVDGAWVYWGDYGPTGQIVRASK